MTKEEVYQEIKACCDIAREAYLRTKTPFIEGKMIAFEYAMNMIKKIDQ